MAVPANVTRLALPAHSPELNAVERAWLYLKERFLSHRLHADYDALVEATCAAWQRLTAETGRTESLSSYPGFYGSKRKTDANRRYETHRLLSAR